MCGAEQFMPNFSRNDKPGSKACGCEGGLTHTQPTKSDRVRARNEKSSWDDGCTIGSTAYCTLPWGCGRPMLMHTCAARLSSPSCCCTLCCGNVGPNCISGGCPACGGGTPPCDALAAAAADAAWTSAACCPCQRVTPDVGHSGQHNHDHGLHNASGYTHDAVTLRVVTGQEQLLSHRTHRRHTKQWLRKCECCTASEPNSLRADVSSLWSWAAPWPCVSCTHLSDVEAGALLLQRRQSRHGQLL